jgi:hypothetical protein
MSIHAISITLACGAVTRAVTPEALARELGLGTVRPALLALLLRPADPDAIAVSPAVPPSTGEGREGVVPGPNVSAGNVSEGPNVTERTNGTNVGPNVTDNKYFLGPNVTERSLPDKQEASSRNTDADERARELADALGDPESLAWYRKVLAALSPDVVQDAVSTATSVPASKLRRSRAAYFTSIVAPLVREAREQRLGTGPARDHEAQPV